MPRKLYYLDSMSDEEQTDWANKVMDDSDPIAKALDIMGWKIVCKDDASRLWPFSCRDTDCDCPKWCEDLSAQPD